MPLPQGVKITQCPPPGTFVILAPPAVEFITAIHREFNDRRLELLEARKKIQTKLDAVSFYFAPQLATPVVIC